MSITVFCHDDSHDDELLDQSHAGSSEVPSRRGYVAIVNQRRMSKQSWDHDKSGHLFTYQLPYARGLLDKPTMSDCPQPSLNTLACDASTYGAGVQFVGRIIRRVATWGRRPGYARIAC